jgi:hypothetical protein
MTLTCGTHMSVVDWSYRHGHNRNFSWRCLRGVRVPAWQVVVACHISEKGNCEWVLKQEWQICRSNCKNGFRVLAILKSGKYVKTPGSWNPCYDMDGAETTQLIVCPSCHTTMTCFSETNLLFSTQSHSKARLIVALCVLGGTQRLTRILDRRCCRPRAT